MSSGFKECVQKGVVTKVVVVGWLERRLFIGQWSWCLLVSKVLIAAARAREGRRVFPAPSSFCLCWAAKTEKEKEPMRQCNKDGEVKGRGLNGGRRVGPVSSCQHGQGHTVL